jgi:hypothetical protein
VRDTGDQGERSTVSALAPSAPGPGHSRKFRRRVLRYFTGHSDTHRLWLLFKHDIDCKLYRSIQTICSSVLGKTQIEWRAFQSNLSH